MIKKPKKKPVERRKTRKGHSKQFLKQLAKRQTAFLVAFRKLGHVGNACKESGVSHDIVWLWRKSDKFSDLYEDARKSITMMLESEAYRRAVTGTLKPVWYQGGQCGTEREFSDMLLKTLLQANDHKYRTNIPLVGGGDGDEDNAFSIVLQRVPKPEEGEKR